MDNHLEKAQTHLNVESVKLRNFYADLEKSYDIQSINDENLDTLGMKGVQEVEEKKITLKEDDSNVSWIYAFTYFSGLKQIPKDADPDSDSVLEIKATYVVTYHSENQVEEKCLKAFALDNVGYHVWPYWREFVGSCCNRFGVPVITVPFYTMTKPIETPE